MAGLATPYLFGGIAIVLALAALVLARRERGRREAAEAALALANTQLQTERAEQRSAQAEVDTVRAALEQRIAHRTRELTALHEVAAIVSRALTPEDLLPAVLEQTLRTLDSVAGAIYLFEAGDESGGAPALRLAVQQGIPFDVQAQLVGWLGVGGLARQVIETGQPLLIQDVTVDARTAGATHLATPRALLVAPLRACDETPGLLSVLGEPRRTFDLQTISLLASIADQVGVALVGDRLRARAHQADVLQERQRLMRDLHDSVTQTLYGLIMLAEAGQEQVEGGAQAEVGQTLARIEEMLRQAVKEMRLFLFQLRSPRVTEEGLVAALRLRLAAVEGDYGVKVRLVDDDTLRLAPAAQEALYWIAQEALNNVLRHAGASVVAVTLSRAGEQAVLELCDDGRGFDPQPAANRGQGLISMRERAQEIGAVLELTSAVGQGTCLRVCVAEAAR